MKTNLLAFLSILLMAGSALAQELDYPTEDDFKVGQSVAQDSSVQLNILDLVQDWGRLYMDIEIVWNDQRCETFGNVRYQGYHTKILDCSFIAPMTLYATGSDTEGEVHLHVFDEQGAVIAHDAAPIVIDEDDFAAWKQHKQFLDGKEPSYMVLKPWNWHY